MEKKGVDGFLDSKEAKLSVLILFSIIMVFVLTLSMSSVFVSALNISIYAPGNHTLNASTSRSINITFNSTWQLGDDGGDIDIKHENVSNCSLWINSTDLKIAWDSVYNTSETTTEGGYVNVNISNASVSYFNFTFPADGNYTFAVACLNASNLTGHTNNNNYTFSGNFSVFVDASAPTFNFTYPLNLSFNTSNSETPIKINFTINDTGLGLNWTNNNSINLSIHLGGTKVRTFTYNRSDFINLTCNPGADVSTATSTCNSTYLFNSNGTYTINATAVDALKTFGFSTITFTVDQIPPKIRNFTITNGTVTARSFNTNGLGNSTGEYIPVGGDGTIAQGRAITAFGNFTDNLTRPLEATLQFFNVSANDGAGAWQTINTTKDGSHSLNISPSATNEFGIINLTFNIPVGRNEFEGKNVTFRMFANDSLGNVNKTGTSAGSVNLTILVNDTFAPTISMAGGVMEVNGTNISDTTPTIIWNVSENNRMTSINISVDFATGTGGVGVDSACGKYAFYDTSSLSASANVERNRNNTFTITEDPACTLLNGTHNVSIVAIDSWGNRQLFHQVFSVRSGTQPGLSFNLSNDIGVTWSKSNTNNTNITSKVGINLFGFGGSGVNVDKVSYFSSCDSTTRVERNATVVYPFNASSCNVQSGNRTLTVTVNDTAGNRNTTVLGFLVDNVGPTVTLHYPTDGQSITGKVQINVSAFDGESQIDSIQYYLDVESAELALNHSANESGLTGSFGRNTSILNITVNATGTHTLKVRVNDTVGNVRNTSTITFTQVGAVHILGANTTIRGILGGNASNVSFFNSTRGLVTGEGVETNQTLELFIVMNHSRFGGFNVTINFNGSSPDWNKTDEIYIIPNETSTIGFLQTNYTTKVIESVLANNSFAKFLPNNNSYFVKVRMVLDGYGSNATKLGGNRSQILYFPDESNLGIAPSTANVTECAFDFSPTHTAFTACWNTTTNLSVDIFLPHFSLLALVNDTVPPQVNVSKPIGGVNDVSGFIPNISVTSDAVKCEYLLNITSSTLISATTNLSSAAIPSNGICTWSEVRFKNGVYNITFNVSDAAGNRNNTQGVDERTFEMLDATPPNNGTSITSSGATDGATITVNSANESITNITLVYGTTATALSNRKSQVITATTSPSVGSLGLSTVAAATLHYYNVTICDFNNNCNTTSNLTFTQTATTAAAAAAAAAADSGGGGGGGAAAVSTVTDSKAQIWQSVPSGSSVTLDVDKSAIAVTSIAVNDVKSELKGVELEVAALSENPVSTEAAAKVYQYFRITKKNIADADAESFKIEFRVTKTWLSENGLASADVALYRFAGDKWNELVTTVASTDATYANYEADTPGFSSFAVGTKSGVKVEEEAPAGEEAAEEEKEAAPPEAVGAPKPVEAPGKAPVAWIIAAIVVILGIVLIVVYQKQKKKA